MKKPLDKGAPPDSPEEWEFIHTGAERSHLSWKITGPIHAAVSNWKAWLIIIGVLGAFNSPEIADAFRLILGGLK